MRSAAVFGCLLLIAAVLIGGGTGYSEGRFTRIFFTHESDRVLRGMVIPTYNSTNDYSSIQFDYCSSSDTFCVDEENSLSYNNDILNDTAALPREFGQWNYAFDYSENRGYIYYVTGNSGSIRRLREDGYSHELVVTPGGLIVSNVAVDEVDQVVYFLTESPTKFPLVYGLVQPHALWAYSMRSRQNPRLIYDGLRTCGALTLDRVKGVAYFFNYTADIEYSSRSSSSSSSDSDPDEIPYSADVTARIRLVGISIDTNQVAYSAPHSSDSDYVYPDDSDVEDQTYLCRRDIMYDPYLDALVGPDGSTQKLLGSTVYLGHKYKTYPWTLELGSNRMWSSDSSAQYRLGFQYYDRKGVLDSKFDDFIKVDSLDVRSLTIIPCNATKEECLLSPPNIKSIRLIISFVLIPAVLLGLLACCITRKVVN